MTPLGWQLLWTASVVTFTFGALVFSSLALFYWRQRRSEGASGRGVFAAFTMVCAAAFLLNLAQQAGWRPAWAPPLMDLVTGMVPALLVHLVCEQEGGPFWVPALFYANSGLSAFVAAAADAGVLPESWSDRADSLPAGLLCAAAIACLVLQARSRRTRNPAERHHAAWMRALLVLMAAASVASVWLPVFALLPDYLLLSIFCVTLYYKERLVFFDLLLKRGAFLGIAFLLLAGVFVFASGRPVAQALVLAPFWLASPWIYGRLSGAIDRVCLRRRYTSAEAERRFASALESAGDEETLRARAAAALEEIFEARADVRLEPGKAVVEVAPRANGMPYLSDDRRLMESLERRLREEHLRLLASRAELKALRAQINPHFLFTALNAIAGFIHSDARAAEDTVEQLAEVFRYTLRKSGSEWVRLDEEMEFVRAYLRIEQARFGERLHVDIAIDPAAAAIPVPVMCVQPLVENAVKHGASQVEGRGEVSVRAAAAGDTLTIDVRDNGPGFPDDFRAGESAAGHGLRNIAGRLAGYYGGKASLACANDSGARVTIAIPRNGSRADAGTDRR